MADDFEKDDKLLRVRDPDVRGLVLPLSAIVVSKDDSSVLIRATRPSTNVRDGASYLVNRKIIDRNYTKPR